MSIKRFLQRSLSTTLLLSTALVYGKTLNGFDLGNALIDVDYIVQGGPPRDGIPAINAPRYVTAEQADFLLPDDIVLGYEIAGKTYAYARHILNWHEIVNHQAHGNSFVITYCPLCGSGMAFSSEVSGQRLEFGVSGLLYNNDLLFYDKQTESLWSQIERRAIAGEYVGEKLDQLKLEHNTWRSWREKYPQTLVLSEDQGFKRNYRHDPYTGYETNSQVFFKTLREAPSEFHTKEKVLGLVIGESAKAYPFSELAKTNLSSFEDQLEGVRFRVNWNADTKIATIESLDQSVLTPTVAYWFAWFNFHPNTQIYRAKEALKNTN